MMDEKVTAVLQTWQETLAQLIDDNQADLVSGYVQVLRETLFNRRTNLRPSMIKRIAEDEVAVLAEFLAQPAYPAFEHGVQLHKFGLNEQAILRLGQVTRQFFLTHLPETLLAHALPAYDLFQESVVMGHMQTQEELILKEQELIRSALQTAVSRYMVEIKEIEAIAQKATEANEFKTHFIARMGHELRTPLGAMLGITEMLQEGVFGSLSAEQKDLTQRIINNAQVLKQVFTELLDQSQIESGQLHLRDEPFSPQLMAESITSNYLPLALKKGVSMQVRLDSDLPARLMGDKARIEQVISNLVTNAIKFTEVGLITVYAFKADEAHWKIEVKDTGIGIAPEHFTYIFEAFRQADETTARKHGGVGLGLSIVQQLVLAMDGTVDLKSKLGQGSVFTVTLPLRKAP